MAAKTLTLTELADAYELAASLYDTLEGVPGNMTLLVQLANLMEDLEVRLSVADPLADISSEAVPA